MSRAEQDREDLLAEATALVERVELSLSEADDHVVVGFRRHGCASVFFGPDPVYQFTSDDKLRRAFVGGLLIKAEAGRLFSLDRQRGSGEVRLVRHELTDDESSQLRSEARARLRSLHEAIVADRHQTIGRVP
ncbi:MAG: hypothetical protein IIA67_08125, partial [Planctomycetes bacterium]|nr:hypothetical protein [Planctomycetota bacterium]